MATGNTRVKVSKDKLVQKLKTSRADLESKYEADLKAYDKNIEPFKKNVLKALDDYRKTLENDFSNQLSEIGMWRGQGTIHVPITVKAVDLPQKPNFESLDRMISALELSDEITITIGVNDQYYRYI